MKKKIFSRIDLYLIAVVVISFIVFSIGTYKVGTTWREEAFRSQLDAANSLSAIVSDLAKQDLLMGNYRSVWTKLASTVDSGLLYGFTLRSKEGVYLVEDPSEIEKYEKLYASSKWTELSRPGKLNNSISEDRKYMIVDEGVGLDPTHPEFLIRFIFSNETYQKVDERFRNLLVLGYVLVFAFFLIAFAYLRRQINLGFFHIKKGIDSILGEGELSLESSRWIDDLLPVSQMLFGFKEKFDRMTKQLEEKSQVEALSFVAKQVAHDIRSPLSALNIAVGSLDQVPEERRLLIRNAVQRINDIANDLLRKAKDKSAQVQIDQIDNMDGIHGADGAMRIEPTLIATLIDTISSEKRIQYREKINVQIETDLKNSFGAFALANTTELARIVSNLVNNSVEALSGENGLVTISVRAGKNEISIYIKDNGAGISREILERLGQKGVTSGKEGQDSGSGIGIYHAKRTLAQFGGSLNVISATKSESDTPGTIVEIRLPRIKTPTWFCDQLNIPEGGGVAVVDDDLSIHQIWKGRLESLRAKEFGVTQQSFTSGLEFMKSQRGPNEVYFVDYEFLNQNINGLEIIEKLGIASSAVLITSRYEETHVRERAERLGVRILPKQLAGFVPIEIVKAKEPLDYVLIDDDELVHMTWKMNAQAKQHKMKSFRSPEEFLNEIALIDFATPIYVDSKLGKDKSGKDIRGEEFAEHLSVRGFVNLYLATGFEPEAFAGLRFLKGVVGKEPPATTS